MEEEVLKVIVVNNPAARESGALTILEDFLQCIFNSKCKNKFYIFVSIDRLKKYQRDNVKIIVLKKQNFIDRIYWDQYGLKKYLKKHNIEVDLFLSLQNTGVNLNRNIPQIIYYHQSLSISDKKWSILKKNERKFWFYKNIYPFFIKRYLEYAQKIIVQTEWIKKEFSRKFGYSKKNIFVIKPKIFLPNASEVTSKLKFRDKVRIFYPATPLIYKNHKLIIEVINSLNLKIPNLANKIECIFTFSKEENIFLTSIINKYNLESIIKLIGKIEYKEVLQYYKSSDLLIFPSYIETLGLPLIEAQYFNLKILAIDLPYSREVLKTYDKVLYFTNDLEKKLLEIFKEMEI